MIERARPSVPHDSNSSSSSSGRVVRRSNVSISSADFFVRQRMRDEGAVSGDDVEDGGYE